MSVRILFPAIDLKGGQCVRLKLGDMDQATVYNENPGAQAKAFEDQGFKWLHVVDLDGAFAGEAVNGAAVEDILANTNNPVQLGGGIRTLEHIEYWLDKGIARVILGTIAVRDPDLVRAACKKFPGKIAVGIDAKGGKVAVEGWAETSELTVIDMAARFEDAGVAAIIFTDIDRDGVLTGINWESTLELARSTKIPVIASGGLASMDDIGRMTRDDAQILQGAISGRALYDGRIDPFEAIQMLQGNRWVVHSPDSASHYYNLSPPRREMVRYVLDRVQFIIELHLMEGKNKSLDRTIRAFSGDDAVSIQKKDLEIALNSLHRVVYELGEYELQTITSLNLQEFMSAGLLLYGGLNEGTYMGSLWAEGIRNDP